ncbi:hypothetical protein DEIPH_ctg021orf0038 [Deinococcus phoenicis]|uniref:Uncharacterized protein n=1 Tax=Deinococcus phoenicis TaxID=1476583 RepID=A0A016QRN6_9DEIO|nr:hypothetical protein DEIPH_ctg021orf0038 [Deinococcus phoenicis]
MGDLEIRQDLEFHRREVRAENVGWAVMLLILLAALLGLFGSGPLSKATAQAAGGGLTVKYNRFARYLAPAELTLTFSPDSIQEGGLHVWLSREFLQHVQIQQITPEPDSVQLEGQRLTYTFKALKTGQPQQVVFQLEMQAIGTLKGAAGLAGTSAQAGQAEEVQFSSFIYP